MKRIGADREERFFEWLKKKDPGAKVMGREYEQGKPLKSITTGGWPDFAIKTSKGIIEFYEVKREGDQLQPHQKEILELLKNLGAEVYIAKEVKKGEFSVESF